MSTVHSTNLRPLLVLTGAAGGIGRELISCFSAQGYDVLALVRKPSALDDVVNATVNAIACDLADATSVLQAVDAVRQTGRAVDLLVHCAGVICPADITTLTQADLDVQVAVNLTAPILLTSQMVGLMPKGSQIIFINSMAGAMPLKGSCVYAATKFGLRGFALSLAMDLRTSRIRVSSIFPGAVDTVMLHKEMSEGGSALNFVSAPATPGQIAKLVLRTAKRPKLEAFRPWIDGVFAHLCLLQPALLRISMPILLFFGKRGQKSFLKKRGK